MMSSEDVRRERAAITLQKMCRCWRAHRVVWSLRRSRDRRIQELIQKSANLTGSTYGMAASFASPKGTSRTGVKVQLIKNPDSLKIKLPKQTDADGIGQRLSRLHSFKKSPPSSPHPSPSRTLSGSGRLPQPVTGPCVQNRLLPQTKTISTTASSGHGDGSSAGPGSPSSARNGRRKFRMIRRVDTSPPPQDLYQQKDLPRLATLVVARDGDGSVLGTIWREKSHLQLFKVHPGSAADLAGASQFLRYYLVRANGQLVTCVDELREAMLLEKDLSLTFSLMSVTTAACLLQRAYRARLSSFTYQYQTTSVTLVSSNTRLGSGSYSSGSFCSSKSSPTGGSKLFPEDGRPPAPKGFQGLKQRAASSGLLLKRMFGSSVKEDGSGSRYSDPLQPSTKSKSGGLARGHTVGGGSSGALAGNDRQHRQAGSFAADDSPTSKKPRTDAAASAKAAAPAGAELLCFEDIEEVKEEEVTYASVDTCRTGQLLVLGEMSEQLVCLMQRCIRMCLARRKAERLRCTRSRKLEASLKQPCAGSVGKTYGVTGLFRAPVVKQASFSLLLRSRN
eukprot:Rhum_TRINITY_DN12276_c0_g3::Rhum_TRINITY_DN12276_c0_g3_i1::g.50649::m.50649